MNRTALLSDSGSIDYPESDGEPMADNTLQFQWIVVLFGNIAAMYRDTQDVFVSGNQFWYPVEGHPEVVVAPDVYVVFGRPKGHRSSYQQWLEGNVPMTVVFEVLSPKNDYPEMADKLAFYEEYGVEEYYVFDPLKNHLQVHLRQDTMLRRVRPVQGFRSPRLGIQFDLSGPEMVVRRPDGQPFLTFEELTAAREREEHLRLAAERRADQEAARAGLAEQRADQEAKRASRLAELSRKVRRHQATPEELAELDRLEESP